MDWKQKDTNGRFLLERRYILKGKWGDVKNARNKELQLTMIAKLRDRKKTPVN